MTKTIIQIIKFSVVGITNAIISYTIYSGLVYIGLHYIIANLVSFLISVFISFLLNYNYVFINKNDQKRNIIRLLFKTYASYAFNGLILQNFLLFFLIDLLHLSKYIAPFFSWIITIPLNFILLKYWAFQPDKHNKDKLNEKNQCVNTLL